MSEEPRDARCRRCERLESLRWQPHVILRVLAKMDPVARSALTAHEAAESIQFTDDGLPQWWTGTHAELRRLWSAFADNVAHIEEVSDAEEPLAWPAALIELMHGTVLHAARPAQAPRPVVSGQALPLDVEAAANQAVERLLPAAVEAASRLLRNEMKDLLARPPRDPLSQRYLDLPDAAAYLGTTIPALKMRVSRRTIPFIKDGRRIRFDVRALDADMKKHAIPDSRMAIERASVAERLGAARKKKSESKGPKPWKFRSSRATDPA